MRTYDNEVIIVPNSEFTTQRLTNWTVNDDKVRLSIRAVVAHDSDPQEVTELLLEVARRHPDVLAEPAPEALLAQMTQSALTFSLRFWTIIRGNDNHRLKSDLRLLILETFQQHGFDWRDARGCCKGLRRLKNRRSKSRSIFVSLRKAIESAPANAARVRVLVMGQPHALGSALQEQIFLIGRDAVLNALRHSNATRIETEVEYLPHRLCVVVRDNGRGIDAQLMQSRRDSYAGQLSMCERARRIGAQVQIWSGAGSGYRSANLSSSRCRAGACA